jgi:hypothetical protein
MIYEISNDGKKLTINNGKRIDNYSQRKNQLNFKEGQVSVGAAGLCNTTSMCHALEICGWILPISKKYARAPDALADFLLNDPDVDEYYSKEVRDLWKIYDLAKKGKYAGDKNNIYPPNEVHKVLAYGTNLWMGQNIVDFKEGASIEGEIIYNLVIKNLPVVTSIKVTGLNHIVTLVGCVFDLDDKNAFSGIENLGTPAKDIFKSGSFNLGNTTKTDEAVKDFLDISTRNYGNEKIFPSLIICDDAYGMQPSSFNNYKKYEAGTNGNDNLIDYDKDFIPNWKPLGDQVKKLAHFFRPAAIT